MLFFIIAIAVLRAASPQQSMAPVPSIRCSEAEAAARGQAGGQNGASRGPFCGSIEGTVINSIGSAAITNAIVILELQEGGPFVESLSTRTDDIGRYSFPQVNPQYSYNMVVTADGFSK